MTIKNQSTARWWARITDGTANEVKPTTSMDQKHRYNNGRKAFERERASLMAGHLDAADFKAAPVKTRLSEMLK